MRPWHYIIGAGTIFGFLTLVHYQNRLYGHAIWTSFLTGGFVILASWAYTVDSETIPQFKLPREFR